MRDSFSGVLSNPGHLRSGGSRFGVPFQAFLRSSTFDELLRSGLKLGLMVFLLEPIGHLS